MAEYRVYFRESVEKDLAGVPESERGKILRRIEGLAGNPGQRGYEKLTGEERYRLREGRYRIVYSIEGQELTVWAVIMRQRKGLYR